MAAGTIVFTAVKNTFAMKLEATPYTYGAPASVDFDTKFNNISVELDREEYEQEFASGRHSFGPSSIGKGKAVYKASAPFLFGASATASPKLGKALNACGALQTVTFTLSTDLITSNSVACSVNGNAITPVVFATSHTLTWAAVATAVQALGSGLVCTATTSGDILTITALPGVSLTATLAVTLGSSQPTVTGALGIAPNAAADQVPYSFGVQCQPTSGNAVNIAGKGGMGTWKLMTKNDAAVIEFTFTASLVGITDATALVLTSADTGYAPLISNNATISDASQLERIGEFELDAGNDIQPIVDGSTYTGFYIAKRKPVLSMDPAVDLLANNAHYTRWSSGSQSVISVATTPVSGRTLTITAPAAQIQGKGFKMAKRGEENTYKKTFALQESAGNDEWKLTIT